MKTPEHLIQAFFDENLTEAQAQELSDWIHGSPEHASYLTFLSRMEWRMTRHYRTEIKGSLLSELLHYEESLGELELVDFTEEFKRRRLADAQRKAASLLRHSGQRSDTSAGSHGRYKLAVAGLIAASIFLAIGLFFGMQGKEAQDQDSPSDRMTSTQPAQTQQELPPPALATVVDQAKAVWSSPPGDGQTGQPLGTQTYALEEGLVELQLSAGTTLIIEGPAQFELLTPSHVVFTNGSAAIRVPDTAEPILIDYQGLQVECSGGEFGLSNHTLGQSRIDVYQGSVHAISQGALELDLHVVAGQGAVQAGQSHIELDDVQHDACVRDLESVRYADSVLANHPVSYWPLQSIPSEAGAEDRAPDGERLFLRLGSASQAEGPNQDAGYWFDGSSILDLVPTGSKYSTRYNSSDTYTLEAWVHPAEPAERQYLFIADTSDTIGWGVGVKPTGRPGSLGVFLEVAGQEWFFDTAEVPTGDWSHLVLTRDSAGVARVYVDGVEVGMQAGVSSFLQSPLYVHLAGRVDDGRWHGGMAHVAVYDRCLVPEDFLARAQHSDSP